MLSVTEKIFRIWETILRVGVWTDLLLYDDLFLRSTNNEFDLGKVKIEFFVVSDIFKISKFIFYIF